MIPTAKVIHPSRINKEIHQKSTFLCITKYALLPSASRNLHASNFVRNAVRYLHNAVRYLHNVVRYFLNAMRYFLNAVRYFLNAVR